MARRTRRSGSRSRVRRTYSRSTRGRSYSRVRRSTGRRAVQTVRVVIAQEPAGGMARLPIGMKPADGPKKARF